jgi:hypothetical protein
VYALYMPGYAPLRPPGPTGLPAVGAYCNEPNGVLVHHVQRLLVLRRLEVKLLLLVGCLHQAAKACLPWSNQLPSGFDSSFQALDRGGHPLINLVPHADLMGSGVSRHSKSSPVKILIRRYSILFFSARTGMSIYQSAKGRGTPVITCTTTGPSPVSPLCG